MIDKELEEILFRHNKNIVGDDTITALTFKGTLSAMREAIQKGIDEHEATKRGYTFDKWLIEQRLKTLEAVEKGSIEFAEWINRNCAGNQSSDELWDFYKNDSIKCLPSEQLYKEYKIYLQDQNKK